MYNNKIYLLNYTNLQFTVQARDQSEPEKKTAAQVQISLSRDQYPPTVAFPRYEKEITENEGVNSSVVVRIIAQDQDLKVNMDLFNIFSQESWNFIL